MKEKILVISHMPILKKCSGPSLRMINISKVLSNEFSVQLYSRKTDDTQLKRYSFLTSKFWNSMLDCTVVYSQPSRLRYLIIERILNKKIVIDLYDPTDIENLEMYRNSKSLKSKLKKYYSSYRLKLSILVGDYFVCSNEKQKDYWIGYLQGFGKNLTSYYDDNDLLENFIGYLPFGLESEKPITKYNPIKNKFEIDETKDKVLIWAGGLWNWFDSANLVQAMYELRDRKDIKLLFLGVPGDKQLEIEKNKVAKKTIDLAKSLGIYNENVLFNNEWVEYEERHNYLMNSYAGISLHFDNLETKFSYRTRILDYIWCNLPYITSKNDYFANINVDNQYGVNVECNDVESIKNGILKIIDDKEHYVECKKNLMKLQENSTWEISCFDLIKKLENFKVRKKKSIFFILVYFISIPFRVLYSSIMEG